METESSLWMANRALNRRSEKSFYKSSAELFSIGSSLKMLSGREAVSLAFMLGYVKRGVSWKEQVDKITMRLSEAGIVDHLVRDGVSALHLASVIDPTMAATKSKSAVAELKQLGVKQIQGVFLFLFGGLTVAILFYVTESRYWINNDSLKLASSVVTVKPATSKSLALIETLQKL